MKLPLQIASLCLLAATAVAQQTSANIQFSDPSRPGLIRIYVSHGDIEIRGGDVEAVTVSSSAQPEGRQATRRDGLRVLSTASSFTLTESNNVIELSYGADSASWGGNADFRIVVPRSTAIDVTTGWGGDVDVREINGDVEVKNMNGEIDLVGLGGGALVETMNGEISASFTAIPTDKPLSFTSMNGEIAVRLPADAKANVRFRTQNGSILTDFDDTQLVTRTEAAAVDAATSKEAARLAGEIAREVAQTAREVAAEVRAAVEVDRARAGQNSRTVVAPRPPRPPSIPAMAGGKVVSGALNGGGIDIQIASMNGDIVVRKNVPPPARQ